jgi:beta-lactamase superfamily II metal-dependent hydrolase
MIVSNKSNESSGIFVNIRGTTFLLSGDHNQKAAFAILKSGYDMYN